jgi:hypothetical protein
MEITELDFDLAEKRAKALREAGHAVSARYDRSTQRIVIDLSTGVQLVVPASKIEGLSGAAQEDLDRIEISPAGLALHWPALDADVYLPSLLQGILGTKRWMAAQLGATGGKSRSVAKSDTARENGRKGGRPRKAAAR